MSYHPISTGGGLSAIVGQTDPNKAGQANLDANMSAAETLRAELLAKEKEEEEAAAASAEEEKKIISTSERIETRKGDISALESRKTVLEDISFSEDHTPEQKTNAAAELKVIDKRIIEKEAEQKNDLEKGKLDLKKLGDNLSTGLKIAIGGSLLYEWWNKEDPAAPPDAKKTALALSEVVAGSEFNINRQIGNYGAGFGTDALQDEEIFAEWDAANRPDFNTWVQSVMQDPSSPTARKLASMLDPLNVERREREGRIEEASEFYNEYDASQFQSPEMRAAQSYASGLTSDPLSMRNRQYMEQELAGDYSQGWYDDLRSDLFSSMHPGAVNTSLGMTKAALGAEGIKRERRDAASDRITRDDVMRTNLARTGYEVAAGGSVDPLSLSNVGKMGIGNIEPMDPTGAFFSSFPAMAQDTALAAFQRQPTTMQTLTALGQAAQG